MQYQISKEYIIPFIQPFFAKKCSLKVLEIGCAEAGVLKAFTEQNHTCTGIELQRSRVKLAKQFMAKEVKKGQIKFIAKNIYDVQAVKEKGLTFDLIILKDVIEHIHDQGKFMSRLSTFLTPDGKVFFGYPPWQMPFGGHQQVCKSKFLSALPYFHLLPKSVYKFILKAFGENESTVKELMEIKETGISIERFERILKVTKYKVLKKQYFLTNPIYKYKFKLKVLKQNLLIGSIPFLRNFFTTCAYYFVEPQSHTYE